MRNGVGLFELCEGRHLSDIGMLCSERWRYLIGNELAPEDVPAYKLQRPMSVQFFCFPLFTLAVIFRTAPLRIEAISAGLALADITAAEVDIASLVGNATSTKSLPLALPTGMNTASAKDHEGSLRLGRGRCYLWTLPHNTGYSSAHAQGNKMKCHLSLPGVAPITYTFRSG